MKRGLAKRLGPSLTASGRHHLGRWVRGETTQLFVPYDGVRDWSKFGAVLGEYDFHDGTAGVVVNTERLTC